MEAMKEWHRALDPENVAGNEGNGEEEEQPQDQPQDRSRDLEFKNKARNARAERRATREHTFGPLDVLQFLPFINVPPADMKKYLEEKAEKEREVMTETIDTWRDDVP